MSLAPLMGLPGRVKILLDRIGSSTPTQLARLDDDVSSRAPASTALSSSTWTGARAAKLDNLDGAVSASKTVLKSQEFLSSGNWVRPAGVDQVWVTAVGGGGGGGNGNGSSGGGGAGGGAGCAVVRLPLMTSANLTVVIGSGGSSRGGRGGSTSVGSIVAAGGEGGSGSGGDGGASGSGITQQGAGGNNRQRGESCGHPGGEPSGALTGGAGGGGSIMGAGADHDASAGANTGAGGGGGSSTADGGSGGSGYALIEWFE